MTYTLDFHDFSILNNRFDLLLQLKEHFPKMKVSMFAIPFDYRHETNATMRMMRPYALDTLKKNLDWIELIPHGLSHMPREFEKADKEATQAALKAIDEMFARDGLPYVKGFCAPFWLWNQEVVDVLDQENWWGATDKHQPNMLKTKRAYTYTASIAEPFWDYEGLIQLHGHIDGTSANDIGNCFGNLMRLDPQADWLFVSQTV